jgi:hypothetical protein
MSAPVDSSGLDRLVESTLQALGQARGVPENGDDGSETVQGIGDSAEGLVRAVAVPGGQLAELYLDPMVSRLEPDVLAGEIITAVNAAMADLQEQIAGVAGAPDLDALASRLKEVQEESSRQMGSFMQALEEAQARMASQGRR